MPHATAEDDVYNGFFIPKGWFPQRKNPFLYLLICILRSSGNRELMVRYLPYSFLPWLQLL
jgi:hypothetical protein